jgi:MFS family permease
VRELRPPEGGEMKARGAVAVIFFVNGIVLASWIPHIPALKTDHGLDDGRLGLVLLSMAVGSVLALPMAGSLIGRLGSRRMTSIAASAFCLSLPLPVISPNVPLAALALLILGAGNAMLDVSMNAQAALVEARYRRPIMSSFHALWSVGGVVGAALASAAMGARVGPRWHVIGVAATALSVVLVVRRGLLPTAPSSGPRGPVFVLPPASVLSLGILTFCGLLAEGAVGDWSGVYLRDALGASASVAAIGFAAFSLAMAAGRFAGDRLAARLGAARLLRLSGATAVAGIGGALLLGTPLAAIAGFGLVGLGIANVIPVLFSAAGRVPGTRPEMALAAVATTGYFGFLTGPPLIGLTAELTSLSAGLGVVGLACAVIAARASALTRSPARTPEVATLGTTRP